MFASLDAVALSKFAFEGKRFFLSIDIIMDAKLKMVVAFPESVFISVRTFINPIALRKAKIAYNFGLSECSRAKTTLQICHKFSSNILKHCCNAGAGRHKIELL